MPIRTVHGLEGIASLLMYDIGDGKLWGENLMKLAGHTPIPSLKTVVADDLARKFIRDRR